MGYYKERKLSIVAFILLIISLILLCFSYVHVDFDSTFFDEKSLNIGCFLSASSGLFLFLLLVLLIVFIGCALISKKLSKPLMVVFSIMGIFLDVLIFVTPYTLTRYSSGRMTFWGILAGIFSIISTILLLINSHSAYDYEE